MIEPGCYIDGAIPREPEEVTEVLLDILDSLGGYVQTFQKDLEEGIRAREDSQYFYELDLEIEDAINDELPDGIAAGWFDGNFLVYEIEEEE